ncbi:O-fucosyltransferase family protein [Wolffia australiana]
MFHGSKIKIGAFLGILLSFVSLIIHLYITNSSNTELIYYRLPVDSFYGPRSKIKALWGPVSPLTALQPYTDPSKSFRASSDSNNGYIYAKIHGGFERIRSSICDLVAVARLLNATLVIPELQASLQSKGISSKFRSFSYLYNEMNFIEALEKDVIIVGSLPKDLKEARKKNKFPIISPKKHASPGFYLDDVLPKLQKAKVVGLVITDGGCLQSVLPPTMKEYQRLRCRVAFKALDFRTEIKALGSQIVERLRASGKPYLAYHPGLVRDTLAFHGCAELFQDLHTELVQYRRKQMIEKGLVREQLSIDSFARKGNGSCPLMPEEVGLLLRAMGYAPDTIIYVVGSETFGGQRVLLPLRALYGNTVDRSSLCSKSELSNLPGSESPLPDSSVKPPPPKTREQLKEEWNRAGPRPRPLPPPPGRSFYAHEKTGWYGWLADADVEPERTIIEHRREAHHLLWDAVDYHVAVEADAFFPGFQDDGGPWPDLAGLIIGHRLHKYPSRVTFRPDRKSLAELFSMTRGNHYHPGRNWTMAAREQLKKAAAAEAMLGAAEMVGQLAFLSHPLPECSCVADMEKKAALGTVDKCPEWIKPSSQSMSLVSEFSGDEDTEDDSTAGDDDMDTDFLPEPMDTAGGSSEQDDEMDPDD